jgi:hypothetical protein
MIDLMIPYLNEYKKNNNSVIKFIYEIDNNHNTYLHRLLFLNKISAEIIQILTFFIKHTDLNQENYEGTTSAHILFKKGYWKSLKNVLTIQEVGETVTTDGLYLYFTEAEDTYWFNTISKMDMKTKKVKQIYKEKDKKYVLRIEKPENQPDIFITRICAIYQDIAIIKNDKLHWIDRGFGRKKPIAEGVTAYDSYFKINKKKVLYPDDWKFVDAYRHTDGYVFIFTKDTFHSLWYCNNQKQWIKLNKNQEVCDMKFSAAANKLIVGFPNKPDEVWLLNVNNEIVVENTIKGKTYEINNGKTPVPWFSIQSSDKPKAVVICGYGF